MVYVDDGDLPGAIRPSGLYRVHGPKVAVRLVLKRDHKTVKALRVEGSRDDLPGLAARIAEAITKAVEKL